MCGRYHFGYTDSQFSQKIKQRAKKLKLTYKTGEIFPTDNVLCIMNVGSSLDLAVKKWGIRNKTNFQINARIESVNEKNFYKDLKNHRCVLLCDGFYEWDKEKNKYFISLKEEYFYLAAIYNDNDELLIITKEAHGDFNKIHDREPLILNKEEVKDFLINDKYDVSLKEFQIELVNEEIKLF